MRAIILFLLVGFSDSNNTDRFNYRATIDTDFGPEEWNQITCDNPGECNGWPDSWELGVGWELGNRNNCAFCPADRNNEENKKCDMHRQSPINLERAPSISGHDTECYDYHWMAYQDGTCDWHDMIMNGFSRDMNNFKIERHALQILQPIDDTGTLQCNDKNGRNFPKLDYSKGFPDWWFLSHTEVTVPSEHTQHGKRYDAEVHLSHFYSVEHERKVGKVAIFLEADPNRERWDFLDKMICQWREAEEKTRDECGKASVPPYPGCRNPTRAADETSLVNVDPYPFIDCDSVTNSQRICKPTSCCEEERSTTRYCQNDVYGEYGEQMTGSICWWCCPGKILAPDSTTTGSSGGLPDSTPNRTLAPTIAPTPAPTPESIPQPAPAAILKPTPAPILSYKPNGKRGEDKQKNALRPHKIKPSGNPPTTRPTPIPQVKAQAPTQTHVQEPIQAPTPLPPTKLPTTNSGLSSPTRLPSFDLVVQRTPISPPTLEKKSDVTISPTRSLMPTVSSKSSSSEQSSKSSSNSSTNNSRRISSSSIDIEESTLEKTSEASDVRLLNGMWVSELNIDPSNFVVNDNAEAEHLADIENHRKRKKNATTQSRRLNELQGNNYKNVRYSPYQWLKEVRTEYYYRYEGSQMTPPCYETVHYRVMKDPIRINPVQLAELERLLAWRIAPMGSDFNECRRDTAGRERKGSNGNAVDLNRPVQEYHNIHRKVFCECRDWKSKWEEDQKWCELDESEREEYPYNFDNDGGY